MDNRLLSEQEAKSHNCKADEFALKLQLAKADKEWVEWIEKFFRENNVVFMSNTLRAITLRAITSSEWKERRKEIGI